MGYIELWSCQICHKKFSQDFQLFISVGEWGGTSNFGHVKSAMKNFHKTFNFSFLGWGGGVC